MSLRSFIRTNKRVIIPLVIGIVGWSTIGIVVYSRQNHIESTHAYRECISEMEDNPFAAGLNDAQLAKTCAHRAKKKLHLDLCESYNPFAVGFDRSTWKVMTERYQCQDAQYCLDACHAIPNHENVSISFGGKTYPNCAAACLSGD